VHSGAWYDGWETRRHNAAEYDWVVIRLGVASGRIRGFEIDTQFFNGNHAPAISIQATFAPNEDDQKVLAKDFSGWKTVLEKKECGPSQRHAWDLGAATKEKYTHVRLLMYPDGGIARFRLYGTVEPVLPSQEVEFDLASVQNGGRAVSVSDQHFGRADNILLPGRGKDMGDGWETKRSRGEHVDWVVVRLGAPGSISRIIIDTAHFRGNFPREVAVYGASVDSEAIPNGHSTDPAVWTQILAPQRTGADKEHEYGSNVLTNVDGKVFSHAKVVIIPDGGIKRFRVFGRTAAPPTAIEAAVPAASETPVSATTQEPVQAPVKEPVELPIQTSAPEPTQAPSQAPVEAVVETPVQAS
jgi:allantoicase